LAETSNRRATSDEFEREEKFGLTGIAVLESLSEDRALARLQSLERYFASAYRR
jgi:hypothetical protein